jgi:peptidoglycan hydrolase FlgJ
MNLHGMTPRSINKTAEELPSTQKKDAQLEKACKEFESLFLNQLLTAMRKTIPKGGMDEEEGGSREREMYESMLDSEMAKSWSQSDGIGLANVLYQQLKHNKGKQA